MLWKCEEEKRWKGGGAGGLNSQSCQTWTETNQDKHEQLEAEIGEL